MPRLADCLHLRADLARERGDLSTARALHERGLAIRRESDHPRGVAHSLLQLGRTVALQEGVAAARALYEEALRLRRDGPGDATVAGSLEGLAAVAAAEEQPERAVRLLAAAASIREVSGACLVPCQRPGVERTLAATRVLLDNDTFAAAWAAGSGLTLQQAIAEGLTADKRVERASRIPLSQYWERGARGVRAGPPKDQRGEGGSCKEGHGG
jgi:hypothetical protein